MKPPHLADRLLALFCAPHLLEAVQGDLHEEFAVQVERLGARRARWWYWREVLGFLKPFAVKRQPDEFNQPFFLPPTMLRNYFKIALRTLWRQKAYAVLNLVGLAVGLSAAALVFLHNRYEHSFDDFYRLANRTYRVSGKNQGGWFAALSAPYSRALHEGLLPEAETVVRARRWPPKFIRHGEQKLYEDKVLMTDPGSAFFGVFDLPFVEGTAHEALRKPNSVVLTASTARRLFGNAGAVGKPIAFDTLQLVVTGVVEDLRANTHLAFNVLIANASAMQAASAAFTYCVLPEGADPNALARKLLALPLATTAYSKLEAVRLLPLPDLHFDATMTYELKPAGNRQYLRLFNLIGLLVVLLVCVNYTNLSIALYTRRRKEIAVRKAIGASLGRLRVQFLGEAVLLSLLCLPLAYGLLWAALPLFNRFMGVQLSDAGLLSPPTVGALLGTALALGLVAGSYPAWVLPRLKTVTLFNKQPLTSRGGLNARQGLVTVQVVVFVAMASGSWVIHRQLRFLRETDLGFAREGVLKLKGAWMVDSARYFRLKRELLAQPAVRSVSRGFVPGDEDYGASFKAPGAPTAYNDLISFETDFDYLPTLGLTLRQSSAAVRAPNRPRQLTFVNETAARRLGYTDAVGRAVVLSPGKQGQTTRLIDGVVNDFHFFSLHQPLAPVMLTIRPFGGGVYENILVKIDTRNLAQTVAFVEQKTRKVVSDIPITAEFLDAGLAKFYEKEEKLASLSGVLLGIALLLSVLGTVGLAAYLTELRTKEVGIRKTLGATVPQLFGLLLRSFVGLMAVALVVGCALSALALGTWLKNFAYRVELAWWTFGLAGMLAVGVVLLTVSFQSLKAALTNPVKSLRSE